MLYLKQHVNRIRGMDSADIPGMKLVVEQSRWLYSTIEARGTALNQRASIFVGVAFTIIVLSSRASISIPDNNLVKLLLVIAAGCLISTIVSGFTVIMVKRIQDTGLGSVNHLRGLVTNRNPDSKDPQDEYDYLQYVADQLLGVADDKGAIQYTEEAVQRKGRFINITQWSLVGAIVCSCIALGIIYHEPVTTILTA